MKILRIRGGASFSVTWLLCDKVGWEAEFNPPPPKKSYVQLLIPSISQYDLIWK